MSIRQEYVKFIEDLPATFKEEKSKLQKVKFYVNEKRSDKKTAFVFDAWELSVALMQLASAFVNTSSNDMYHDTATWQDAFNRFFDPKNTLLQELMNIKSIWTNDDSLFKRKFDEIVQGYKQDNTFWSKIPDFDHVRRLGGVYYQRKLKLYTSHDGSVEFDKQITAKNELDHDFVKLYVMLTVAFRPLVMQLENFLVNPVTMFMFLDGDFTTTETITLLMERVYSNLTKILQILATFNYWSKGELAKVVLKVLNKNLAFLDSTATYGSEIDKSKIKDLMVALLAQNFSFVKSNFDIDQDTILLGKFKYYDTTRSPRIHLIQDPTDNTKIDVRDINEIFRSTQESLNQDGDQGNLPNFIGNTKGAASIVSDFRSEDTMAEAAKEKPASATQVAEYQNNDKQNDGKNQDKRPGPEFKDEKGKPVRQIQQRGPSPMLNLSNMKDPDDVSKFLSSFALLESKTTGTIEVLLWDPTNDVFDIAGPFELAYAATVNKDSIDKYFMANISMVIVGMTLCQIPGLDTIPHDMCIPKYLQDKYLNTKTKQRLGMLHSIRRPRDEHHVGTVSDSDSDYARNVDAEHEFDSDDSDLSHDDHYQHLQRLNITSFRNKVGSTFKAVKLPAAMLSIVKAFVEGKGDGLKIEGILQSSVLLNLLRKKLFSNIKRIGLEFMTDTSKAYKTLTGSHTIPNITSVGPLDIDDKSYTVGSADKFMNVRMKYKLNSLTSEDKHDAVKWNEIFLDKEKMLLILQNLEVAISPNAEGFIFIKFGGVNIFDLMLMSETNHRKVVETIKNLIGNVLKKEQAEGMLSHSDIQTIKKTAMAKFGVQGMTGAAMVGILTLLRIIMLGSVYDPIARRTLAILGMSRLDKQKKLQANLFVKEMFEDKFGALLTRKTTFGLWRVLPLSFVNDRLKQIVRLSKIATSRRDNGDSSSDDAHDDDSQFGSSDSDIDLINRNRNKDLDSDDDDSVYDDDIPDQTSSLDEYSSDDGHYRPAGPRGVKRGRDGDNNNSADDVDSMYDSNSDVEDFMTNSSSDESEETIYYGINKEQAKMLNPDRYSKSNSRMTGYQSRVKDDALANGVGSGMGSHVGWRQ